MPANNDMQEESKDELPVKNEGEEFRDVTDQLKRSKRNKTYNTPNM